MSMRALPARLLLGVWVLATCASAQRTLIVGPGQNWTRIQPAIDAAAHGDRIVVLRGARYGSSTVQPALVVRKGVHIVCERITIDGTIRFEKLPEGRHASLSGAALVAAKFNSNPPIIDVDDCKGSVSVHACTLSVDGRPVGRYYIDYTSQSLVRVRNSRMHLSACTIPAAFGSPTIHAEQSTLTVSNCGTLRGMHRFHWLFGVYVDSDPAPALLAKNSELILDRTSISGGGAADAKYPNSSAGAVLSGGSLSVAGQATISGGQADPKTSYRTHGAPAVQHNGRLVVSRCTLVGGRGTGGGTTAKAVLGPAPISRQLPALVGPKSTTSPGTTLSFEAHAEAQSFVLWIFALESGAPLRLAGIERGFFFDLRSFFVAGPERVSSQGRALAGLPIPKLSALRGTWLQAQVLGIAKGELAASAPAGAAIF